MENLLNSELIKLQDELLKLQNAVAHISRAEKLSQSVIAESKTIQDNYVQQLQRIEEQYTDMLQQALQSTESYLGDFKAQQEAQLAAMQTTLEEYVTLGQKTETIAAEHLEKALEQYSEYLRDTTNVAETQVTKLVTTHEAEINEVRKLIQSHRNFLKTTEEAGLVQLETSMRHNSELLKQSLGTTEQQIKQITDAHQKQIDDLNQVFQTYVDLSQSTSQLTREIRSVDFPQRINNLASAVEDFSQTVKQTYGQIHAIQQEVQRVTAIDWATITQIPEIVRTQQAQMQQVRIAAFVAAAMALASAVLSFIF